MSIRFVSRGGVKRRVARCTVRRVREMEVSASPAPERPRTRGGGAARPGSRARRAGAVEPGTRPQGDSWTTLSEWIVEGNFPIPSPEDAPLLGHKEASNALTRHKVCSIKRMPCTFEWLQEAVTLGEH
ncbi:uncharacterized protein GJ701_016563 isoform 2-T2 [Geothlypis trichas]